MGPWRGGTRREWDREKHNQRGNGGFVQLCIWRHPRICCARVELVDALPKELRRVLEFQVQGFRVGQ